MKTILFLVSVKMLVGRKTRGVYNKIVRKGLRPTRTKDPKKVESKKFEASFFLSNRSKGYTHQKIFTKTKVLYSL